MTSERQPRKPRKPRKPRSRKPQRLRSAAEHRALNQAQREADRNKRLIEAGETFAAHKPSDWHRKSRPGNER